jgi:hypothetical protein
MSECQNGISPKTENSRRWIPAGSDKIGQNSPADGQNSDGQIQNYADKIHIKKKKMVDIYYKVICDRNQYAIEQDPVGVKKRIRTMARNSINKHHKCAYGYILDPTGDILINLHKCKIHAKHGDPIGQVIETLNHEIMHSILLNEHGQFANKQWDNIADELGDKGFLGGFPGEEQTKTTENDIKMDEHNTLED